MRILLVCTLITRASAFGYPFLSYRLTRDLSMPTSTASLVLAAFGGGWLMGQWVTGRACDRFGPRTTLVVGMLVSTPAVAVLGIAHNLALLLFVAVFSGATYDITRPVVGAVVAGALSDDGIRARIGGWRHFAINVGAAVTGGAGGLLCATTGIPALFAVNAAGCAVFALLAFRALPAGPPAHPARGSAGVRKPFTDPCLWLACCGALGGLTCIVGLLSAVPLLMGSDGLSPTAYGLVQLCGAGAVIVLTPLLNPWMSRHAAAARRPLTGLLALGSTSLGLTLGAAALARSATAVALAVTASVPGEIILMVAFGDVLNRLAPAAQQGRYHAAGGMTLALASIAAPVVTGQALLHGGANTAASMFVAAGLLGSLVCVPLSDALRRRTAAHRAPACR